MPSTDAQLPPAAAVAGAPQAPGVRELAARYRGDIVIRRGFAASIDNLVVFAVIGLMARSLNEPSDWTIAVGSIAAIVLYHVCGEAPWGITFGKWCCGIRVVDESGAAPGFIRAVVRTLVRLVEASPLLFGGLPAALIADNTRYRQRLGDLAAQTFVLKLRDLRASFPLSVGARISGPEGRLFERRAGS